MIDDVMGFRSLPLDGKILRFVRGSKREILVSSYIYIFLIISSSKESTRKENKILGRLGETEGGNKGREKKARASNERLSGLEDNEGITPRPDDFKILLLNTDR